ncbi:MAG: hypothetical protein QOH26_39, partial [Actinomycetota bacterium]|nr:hypothetical protein [Actinomycetota bacterium]
MASLQPLLDLLPEERVRALLGARGAVTAPDAARPFLLSALVRHLDRPILAITSRADEAEHLTRDIHAFLGRDGAETFPGWEVLPGEPLSPSVETMGRRLHVLARLGRGEVFVVVTTAQGATQLVAAPGDDVRILKLENGGTVDLDQATAALVDMGYERNYMVERRGEFAVRGGILDVFPPSSERPVRVELWGDEITSLRDFALASQRSLGDCPVVEIAPCRELRPDEATQARAEELMATDDDPALAQLAEGILIPGAERLLPRIKGGLEPLLNFFPKGSATVILEPKRVRDRADEVLEQVEEWANISGVRERHYAPLDEVLTGADPLVMMSSFADPGSEDLGVETWAATAGKPEVLAERLGRLVKEGYRAVIAASLGETAQRLQKNLASMGQQFSLEDSAPASDSPPGGSIVVSELGRGFVLPWAHLALVAESDLTGRRSGAARRRIQSRKRQTSGPLDLADGDLVVHEVHGIGKYAGMVERELLGVHRE